MEVLIIILVAIILIGAFEAANHVVYIGYLKDTSENVRQVQKSLDSTFDFGNKILYSSGNSIYSIPMPIFGKWYVQNVGIVPRNSKMHKMIEDKLKEMKQKKTIK